MRKPSYGRPRTIAPLHTLARSLPKLAIPKLSPPRPPKSAPAGGRPPGAVAKPPAKR